MRKPKNAFEHLFKLCVAVDQTMSFNRKSHPEVFEALVDAENFLCEFYGYKSMDELANFMMRKRDLYE